MPNVITTVLRMDGSQVRSGLAQVKSDVAATDGVLGKLKTGFSGLFTSFGGQAALAGAGVALGAFAADAVGAASDLNESINAVNLTFGESADKIEEFGKTAATSVGLARSEFNALATPLGAILKNAGTPLDEVADKTIVLTQRAADMASVFNTDVSEALGAIQAGLRGEQDPLERFGVSLSAAKVEARALADTGKDSAKALTDQEKQLARVEIILDQTNQTAGDFANTSDELANQTRILKAEYENLKAEIGTELIPVLTDLEAGLLGIVEASKKIPGSPPGWLKGVLTLNPLGQQVVLYKKIADGVQFVADKWDHEATPASDRFNDSVLRGGQAAATAAGGVEQLGDATSDVADEVVDLGDKAANTGIKIGDMAGALEEVADRAADNAAEALEAVASAAEAVGDAVDTAFDDIESRFAQQDLLGDIAQGWEDIATSAEEAVKGGADDRRAYERDVRNQRRAVLDLLDSIEGIPAQRKITLATEIEQGSLQTLHDIVRQLEGGITVPVNLVPQAGFSGVNGVFSPTQASPIINGITDQPVGGRYNVTNIYPVGTTPTSAQQDLTTFYRRNGISRS